MAHTLEDTIAACRAKIAANPAAPRHFFHIQYVALPESNELPADLPEGITDLDISGCRLEVLDGAKLPKTLRYIRISGTQLGVVRNLDQLPTLTEFHVRWNNFLYELTCPLPASLRVLDLYGCRHLSKIPRIARIPLEHLNVGECLYLTSLPDLPSTLTLLDVSGSHVKDLPFLPDSLTALWEYDSHGHRSSDFHIEVLRIMQPINLHKERFPKIHESLMAAAWHPARVSKWLEEGEDVLDMMMGC